VSYEYKTKKMKSHDVPKVKKMKKSTDRNKLIGKRSYAQ